MITFADSSFTNCDDMGTKPGFLVLLIEDTGRKNWLTYSSYKRRRVVRSVLSGEKYEFADCFDATYTIKHDIQVILNRNIPPTTLSNSEKLFKIIVKSTVTTERRPMIDTKETREAHG